MKINKKILLLCYTLTLCTIVWYPASTVKRIEFPAEKPVEMKFRVRLYDPYDPMRGRYVRLQVFPDRIETSDPTNRFPWRSKGKIFAILQRGKDGFAQVVRLEKNTENLKKGEFPVRVSSCWYHRGFGSEKGKKFYTFSLPFKKYFVNEFKAPILEEELRKRSAKNKNMILTVRFFKDGVHAVSSLTYP